MVWKWTIHLPRYVDNEAWIFIGCPWCLWARFQQNLAQTCPVETFLAQQKAWPKASGRVAHMPQGSLHGFKGTILHTLRWFLNTLHIMFNCIAVMCMCVHAGAGSPEDVTGCLSSDCSRHAVLEWEKLHTQRPGSPELHVSWVGISTCTYDALMCNW